MPATANAGIFSSAKDLILNLIGSNSDSSSTEITETSLNDIPLLQNTTNFDTLAAKGGTDLVYDKNNEALISESGPSGTQADIPDSVTSGKISKYIVRKGDNISSIAKMYGVSKNTIVWANDLTSTSLKEGQELIILPVSGTIHTVAKNDTIKTIAKKYKADADEIIQFNNLSENPDLAIGDTIIIPDGEGTMKVSGTIVTKNSYKGGSGPSYDGYYMRPVIGGIKTQGIHGYNAIDIGIPTGSAVMASALGQVMVAKSSGWNGGYGEYVVISHPNGTQTVYGHLSRVFVNSGDVVYPGQTIGLSGNTGKSTGPHLHFEIRGAKNPF